MRTAPRDRGSRMRISESRWARWSCAGDGRHRRDDPPAIASTWISSRSSDGSRGSSLAKARGGRVPLGGSPPAPDVVARCGPSIFEPHETALSPVRLRDDDEKAVGHRLLNRETPRSGDWKKSVAPRTYPRSLDAAVGRSEPVATGCALPPRTRARVPLRRVGAPTHRDSRASRGLEWDSRLASSRAALGRSRPSATGRGR